MPAHFTWSRLSQTDLEVDGQNREYIGGDSLSFQKRKRQLEFDLYPEDYIEKDFSKNKQICYVDFESD